jgi:uncharacterized DUF497 family protein
MQDNRNFGRPGFVVPAKAGTREIQGMDPRFREDDALFRRRWVVVSPNQGEEIRKQGDLQNDADRPTISFEVCTIVHVSIIELHVRAKETRLGSTRGEVLHEEAAAIVIRETEKEIRVISMRKPMQNEQNIYYSNR